MFWIYVIKSLKDGRTYVGYTSDLEARIKQHNSGFVRSTKNRRPFSILFVETFLSSGEAKRRELYWKSGGGRRMLRSILEERATAI